MAATSKYAADAWDRVLDAADALSDLLKTSGIRISEDDLEELTIFIAAHGQAVRHLFRELKPARSSNGAGHGIRVYKPADGGKI
ncbi:YebG family protein [Desulfosarcina sp. OttesenSCG-928-G10]|nr:YebG family protein [Desulfosarcina sp. OttesenSCG-928-G10]